MPLRATKTEPQSAHGMKSISQIRCGHNRCKIPILRRDQCPQMCGAHRREMGLLWGHGTHAKEKGAQPIDEHAGNRNREVSPVYARTLIHVALNEQSPPDYRM